MTIEGISPPYELTINIDGASIHKSSPMQLWPILGSIENSDPFVIAVFFGNENPDVNEFLNDFVNEVKHEDKVKLKAIICDAPARALIKCTKRSLWLFIV